MLALVSNYYNPSRNPIKLRNYQLFRDGINKFNAHLFMVEAAFGDQEFTLPKEDVAHQVRNQEVIWQQHRLFNLAIDRLPEQYDKVAWIDCDIVFQTENWFESTEAALDECQFVQLFREVRWLKKDLKGVEATKISAALSYEKHKHPFHQGGAWPGFAWAGRRETLCKHKIYDYWITGSSDIATVIGMVGMFDIPWFDMATKPMMDHYLKWAKPFHSDVQSSLGWIEATIDHLWHGNLSNRNYRQRWEILQRHNFDPAKDMTIGDNGCFQWSSDKPELHREIQAMCESYDRQ